MNRNTHVVVGAAAGVVAEVMRCKCTGHPVEFWNLVLAAGAAAAFAAVPDLMEPALHPNHRSLFHGLAAAGFAGSSISVVAKHNEWPEWSKALAVGALVGYVSHLALDATTPKGLPVVA